MLCSNASVCPLGTAGHKVKGAGLECAGLFSSSSFYSNIYNWRATNMKDLLDATAVLVLVFFSTTDCDSPY